LLKRFFDFTFISPSFEGKDLSKCKWEIDVEIISCLHIS
jgi:hypothetical protein